MWYWFLLLDLHIILVFCFFYHILSSVHKERLPRPKHWAKPLKTHKLPNLFQVTPLLYRSACPARESEEILHRLGIQTVISLCRPDEENCSFPNIKKISLPMSAKKPQAELLQKALDILAEAETPVLVHCSHGADRTGLVCALYRIHFQNWEKEEALAEMLEGGFGYHIFWQQNADFLRQYPSVGQDSA